MSVKDYDELEKLFSGSWKHDRDENLDAFMDAVAMPEKLRQLSSLKPVVTFSREGNSLTHTTVFQQGMEIQDIYVLNEVLEWKDKEDDPTFHVKILPTFRDGVLTQDVTPLGSDERKPHIVKMYVKEDEFKAETSLKDDSNITAKRVFKKL